MLTSVVRIDGSIQMGSSIDIAAVGATTWNTNSVFASFTIGAVDSPTECIQIGITNQACGLWVRIRRCVEHAGNQAATHTLSCHAEGTLPARGLIVELQQCAKAIGTAHGLYAEGTVIRTIPGVLARTPNVRC